MIHLSKNFTKDEFKCPCCGYNSINYRLMPIAEIIRHIEGDKPISPTSACRCYVHNELVGGADDSFHLRGDAIDMPSKNPSMLALKLNSLFPNMYGIGVYKTFVHIDVRYNKARWNG